MYVSVTSVVDEMTSHRDLGTPTEPVLAEFVASALPSSGSATATPDSVESSENKKTRNRKASGQKASDLNHNQVRFRVPA